MKRVYADTEDAQEILDKSRQSIVTQTEALIQARKQEDPDADMASIARGVAWNIYRIFPPTLLKDIPSLHEYGAGGEIDPALTQDNLIQLFLNDAIQAVTFPNEGYRKVSFELDGGGIIIKETMPTWDTSLEG